ncbi:MAG: hypothetical protein KBS77_00150 [Bacteroidales bacterium]|nr:hypothetical protein [Candidatus Colicola faecequi]
MKKRILILLAVILCAFGMMAQQRYFSIEVRQPAKQQLPAGSPHVDNLLLVNNAVIQPAAFGHQNKENDMPAGTSEVDLSDAVRLCMFGLQNRFEEDESFADLALVIESQNTGGSFYRRKNLTSAKADSLMDIYGSDALLALNQLVLYDVAETYETENANYYAYLQAYCSMQLSIHFRGKTSPFTFVYSDTLMWGNEDISPKRAQAAIPERQSALLDFAYYAGGMAAASLFPQWETEDRYMYYAPDDDMDDAWDEFRHQRWQSAFDGWKEVAESGSKTLLLRAYAMADMAVAAEMMEDYSMAIKCANQAIAFFSKVRTMDAQQQRVNVGAYRDELTKRSSYKF